MGDETSRLEFYQQPEAPDLQVDDDIFNEPTFMDSLGPFTSIEHLEEEKVEEEKVLTRPNHDSSSDKKAKKNALKDLNFKLDDDPFGMETPIMDNNFVDDAFLQEADPQFPAMASDQFAIPPHSSGGKVSESFNSRLQPNDSKFSKNTGEESKWPSIAMSDELSKASPAVVGEKLIPNKQADFRKKISSNSEPNANQRNSEVKNEDEVQCEKIKRKSPSQNETDNENKNADLLIAQSKIIKHHSYNSEEKGGLSGDSRQQEEMQQQNLVKSPAKLQKLQNKSHKDNLSHPPLARHMDDKMGENFFRGNDSKKSEAPSYLIDTDKNHSVGTSNTPNMNIKFDTTNSKSISMHHSHMNASQMRLLSNSDHHCQDQSREKETKLTFNQLLNMLNQQNSSQRTFQANIGGQIYEIELPDDQLPSQGQPDEKQEFTLKDSATDWNQSSGQKKPEKIDTRHSFQSMVSVDKVAKNSTDTQMPQPSNFKDIFATFKQNFTKVDSKNDSSSSNKPDNFLPQFKQQDSDAIDSVKPPSEQNKSGKNKLRDILIRQNIDEGIASDGPQTNTESKKESSRQTNLQSEESSNKANLQEQKEDFKKRLDVPSVFPLKKAESLANQQNFGFGKGASNFEVDQTQTTQSGSQMTLQFSAHHSSLKTPTFANNQTSVNKISLQSAKSILPQQPSQIDSTQTQTIASSDHHLERVWQQFMKMNNNEKWQFTEEQIKKKEEMEKKFNRLFNFAKKKYNFTQDEDLKKEIDRAEEETRSGLHWAFLFSSPLVIKYHECACDQNCKEGDKRCRKKVIKFIESARISYQEEFQQLKKGLKKIEKNFRYRMVCATLKNLKEVLDRKPMSLQFSGHGAQYINNQGLLDLEIQKQRSGSFLMFENEDGTPNWFSEHDLGAMLQSTGTQLQFAFIASCHSEKTAYTFFKAGAKHAIGIRQNEELDDSVVGEFSEQFYKSLLLNQKTICDAFVSAKNWLSNHSNPSMQSEAWKFIIIRDIDHYDQISQEQFYQDQLADKYCHENCGQLGPFEKGSLENIDTEPNYKINFQWDPLFMGRSIEMSQVIRTIHKHKLVTVNGMAGIGKTSIVKHVAILCQERNAFDGIIYLSLEEKHYANDLIAMLYHNLKLGLSTNELKELNNMTIKQEEYLGRRESKKYKNIKEEDESKEFAKQIELNKQDLEKIIFCLQKKEAILLILDGVQDFLARDKADFKYTLHQILSRCTQVKIITTSKRQIHSVHEDFHEHLVTIKSLDKKITTKLFLAKAEFDLSNQKDKEEIQEFLNETKRRDTIQKQDMPQQQFTSLETQLMNHPVQQRLSGHPMVISLIAPLRKNYRLLKIYNNILSQGFNPGIDSKTNLFQPLVQSLDASIQAVQEENPEAVELFCLMGLMPSGVTNEDLDFLWNSKYSNWFSALTTLVRSSLVEKKVLVLEETKFEVERHTIHPFMKDFSISQSKQYEQNHHKICKYFLEIMECEIYKKIDIEEFREEQPNLRSKISLLADNIYACLERIRDNGPAKKGKKDRSTVRFQQKKQIKRKNASAPVKKSQPLVERVDVSLRSDLPIPPKLYQNLQQSLGVIGVRSSKSQKFSTKQSYQKSLKHSSNKCSCQSLKKISRKNKKISHKSAKSKEESKKESKGASNLKGLNFVDKIEDEEEILPSMNLVNYLSESEESIGNWQSSSLQKKAKKSKVALEKQKTQTKQQEMNLHEDLLRHMMGEELNPEVPGLQRQRSNSDFMARPIESQEKENLSDEKKSEAKSTSEDKYKKSNLPDFNRRTNVLTVKQKMEQDQQRKQKYKATQEAARDRQNKNKQGGQAQHQQKWQTSTKIQHRYSPQPRPSQKQTHQKESEQKKMADNPNQTGKQPRKFRGWYVNLLMPIEGKLIYFYSCNLLLSHKTEQAIRILTKFGLSIQFSKTTEGDTCTSNIKKLLAVAHFRTNFDFRKCEYFLTQALSKFKFRRVFHGIACCSLAMAYFQFVRPTEFVDEEKDESQVLSDALEACKEAIDKYKSCNHKIGQAESIRLMLKIRDKLEGEQPQDIKNTWKREQVTYSEQLKDLEKAEKQKKIEDSSVFKPRTMGMIYSLLVELSYNQHKPEKADKFKIQNPDKSDQQRRFQKKSNVQQKSIKPLKPRKKVTHFEVDEKERGSSAECLQPRRNNFKEMQKRSKIGKGVINVEKKKNQWETSTASSKKIMGFQQQKSQKSSTPSKESDYERPSSIDESNMRHIRSSSKAEQADKNNKIKLLEKRKQFQSPVVYQRFNKSPIRDDGLSSLSKQVNQAKQPQLRNNLFDRNRAMSELTFSDSNTNYEPIQNTLHNIAQDQMMAIDSYLYEVDNINRNIQSMSLPSEDSEKQKQQTATLSSNSQQKLPPSSAFSSSLKNHQLIFVNDNTPLSLHQSQKKPGERPSSYQKQRDQIMVNKSTDDLAAKTLQPKNNGPEQQAIRESLRKASTSIRARKQNDEGPNELLSIIQNNQAYEKEEQNALFIQKEPTFGGRPQVQSTLVSQELGATNLFRRNSSLAKIGNQEEELIVQERGLADKEMDDLFEQQPTFSSQLEDSAPLTQEKTTDLKSRSSSKGFDPSSISDNQPSKKRKYTDTSSAQDESEGCKNQPKEEQKQACSQVLESENHLEIMMELKKSFSKNQSDLPTEESDIYPHNFINIDEQHKEREALQGLDIDEQYQIEMLQMYEHMKEQKQSKVQNSPLKEPEENIADDSEEFERDDSEDIEDYVNRSPQEAIKSKKKVPQFVKSMVPVQRSLVQQSKKAAKPSIEDRVIISQQPVHQELIENFNIDKTNLNEKELKLIQYVYQIYISETDDAQKAYYKQQIISYLDQQQIKYSITNNYAAPEPQETQYTEAQRQHISNMDNISVPFNQNYYNNIEKQGPLSAKERQDIGRQLNQAQRQKMKMMRQRTKQTKTKREDLLNLPQEQINEVDEESNCSEGSIEQAKNIEFRVQYDDEYIDINDVSHHIKKKSLRNSFSQENASPDISEKKLRYSGKNSGLNFRGSLFEEDKKQLQAGKNKKVKNVQIDYKKRSLAKKGIEGTDEYEEESKDEKGPKKMLANVQSKIKSFIHGKTQPSEVPKEEVKRESVLKKSKPTVSATGFVSSRSSKKMAQTETSASSESHSPFDIMINSRVRLMIVEQDIVKESTDAIVNSANSFMDHKGGISGQLIIHGGFSIQQESSKWVKKNGPIASGTCAYTSAGKLDCKYLIHTLGPIYKNNPEKKSLDMLKNCVIKSLDTARHLGNTLKVFPYQSKTAIDGDVKTISFPAISMGNFGMPKDIGSRQMLTAFKDWIMQRQNIGKIERIRICLQDTDALLNFRQQFNELFGQPVEQISQMRAIEEEKKEEEGNY